MNENLKKDAKECFFLAIAFVFVSVFGFLTIRFPAQNLSKIIIHIQAVMGFSLCCLSTIISIVLFGKAVWKLIKYKWQKHKETSPIVLGQSGSDKVRSCIKVEAVETDEEE